MRKRLLLLVTLGLVLAGAVALRAAVAAPGPLTFSTGPSYAVGPNADGVVSAYLNSDSYPDLAAVGRMSNSVTILLGDGAGGFSHGATLTVGMWPRSIATSDFDGDTDADLAVTNTMANDVSILLGNGDGSFSYGTTITIGSGIRGIAAGRLNEDDNPDLAVAGPWADEVSILLGDGAGGFSFGTTVTAGSGPYYVAMGDFDGDDAIDLAAANSSDDNVSIRLGDGTGQFSVGATLTVGDFPIPIVSDDVNRDGYDDLFVGNYGDAVATNTVSVFRSDGAGGFTQEPTLTVGSAPHSIAISDLNGDGDSDLAVAGESGDCVSILSGDGLMGFSNESTSTWLNGAKALAVDDFDGDTRPDIAVTLFAGGNLTTLRNTTLFDSSLGLSASSTLVSYNQSAVLRGSLVSNWRVVTGRSDVEVWRKGPWDSDFKRDGLASYDPATGLYLAPRRMEWRTRFRMRFSGAGVYKLAWSPEVLVGARASLSQPSLTPTSPKRNVNFTTSGTLQPRHSTPASTRLYFYRKVYGKWKYFKSVTCSLTNYSTYTRYQATTKLPYAGSWYVRAYHADASHAATWGAVRYFTVKP